MKMQNTSKIVSFTMAFALVAGMVTPESAEAGWFRKAVKKATGHNIIPRTPEPIKKIDRERRRVEHKVAKEVKNGVENVGEGIEATAHFAENQVKSTAQLAEDSLERIKDGDVLGAVGHLAVDPLKNTSDNLAGAMTESSLLRTVGQAASTAYGGPGGAAAFSAWLTYENTGDWDASLKAGAISGATSFASQSLNASPAVNGGEIATKAVTAGVIGAAAVSASGGEGDDVRNAFLMGAAMSAGNDLYQNYVETSPDARASQGEPYCKGISGQTCSPEEYAVWVDEEGNRRVDVRLLDKSRPQVGMATSPGDGFLENNFIGEQSTPMIFVSKIPGMNAMALFHDHWADQWRMGTFSTVATIPVATVFMYTALGTPVQNQIVEENIEETVPEKVQPAQPPSHEPAVPESL